MRYDRIITIIMAAVLSVCCKDPQPVTPEKDEYSILFESMTDFIPAGDGAITVTDTSGNSFDRSVRAVVTASATELIFAGAIEAGSYTLSYYLTSANQYYPLGAAIVFDPSGRVTSISSWNPLTHGFAGSDDQRLVTYGTNADYQGVAKSQIYEVTVIQRNLRQRIAVFQSKCPTYSPGYMDMTATDQYPLGIFASRSISWAGFSFEGSVIVEVKVIDQSKVYVGSQVSVLPSRYGIMPIVRGNIIRFKIDTPGQFSLEIGANGYKNGLMIFADPMETNAPSTESSGYVAVESASAESIATVDASASGIYFKRGIHDIGVYRVPANIRNIYFEAGAWVYGAIIMDARSDVRIFGRGTLSQARLNYRQSHSIEAINGSNSITVEGITVADNKYFSIRLIGTDNKVCWVKIIGAWTYNCDGISAFAGSEVSHCFVWANDDNIKVYRDNTHVSDMTLWQLNNGGCIQMSWGGAMADNVLIERVDILHAEWNNDEHNRGVISCVGDKYEAGKSGYLTRWTIDDLVTETAVPMAFRISPYDYSPCPINGLEMKNWRLKIDSGSDFGNYIEGNRAEDPFRGFVFDNVTINETRLTADNWIQIGKFTVKNLETPVFK